LADSQLKLVAEDAGLDDLWKTGLQDHVVPRLYYNPLKLEELRCALHDTLSAMSGSNQVPT
jgi:hypothetical protein